VFAATVLLAGIGYGTWRSGKSQAARGEAIDKRSVEAAERAASAAERAAEAAQDARITADIAAEAEARKERRGELEDALRQVDDILHAAQKTVEDGNLNRPRPLLEQFRLTPLVNRQENLPMTRVLAAEQLEGDAVRLRNSAQKAQEELRAALRVAYPDTYERLTRLLPPPAAVQRERRGGYLVRGDGDPRYRLSRLEAFRLAEFLEGLPVREVGQVTNYLHEHGEPVGEFPA
jgi:hypothetical protein